MQTIQQRVQYLIAENFIGISNPVIAGDLANHFQISDRGVQVEMRNVMHDAIADGELIGSNSPGFNLIATLAELEENLNSSQNRTEYIPLRRRNMMSNWNNQNHINHSLRTYLLLDFKI